MPVACHVAVTAVCLSSKLKKKEVSAAGGTTSVKRRCPVSAAHCSTSDIDGVKTEKKADCFPLRKRIPELKCVNSEVNSVSSLPTGFPQMDPWHHVGATMEITLDKK